MPKLQTDKLFLKQGGFTLIELLVATAIILLITAIVIFSLRTFGQQIEIESTGQNILSTLRLARSQTLASEGETNYGVHFENDKFVLFSGSNYIAGASSNKEYKLVDSEINNIALNGGGNEVIFERIRGSTSQHGTVTVRLTVENNRAFTININPSGQVSYSEAVTTSDTRIKDSRHLHFDLGSSIQGATTLTLSFTDLPNPPVIQNISMAANFSGGPPPTSFDWSGTVNVNGSDQVLKIHTHSLDSTNTILSIHRDRRYNNKALTVLIDGLQIVSYTALDGIATKGPLVDQMIPQ
jgi:prepilin-type N-terminal cleavage/methylation domain-containing protein